MEKDRSVVPPPSKGELATGIDTAATSFTLSPSGIGQEYPASFRCVIGNEGFDVTRTDYTCAIDQRGLYRGLDDHEAEDLVQIVRRFEAKQVNQIAEAIITEAQPQLADWIPSADWQAEADDYLTRLYSGDITEPTGVNELIAELMDSVPVHFWPDEREQRIEMRAIKSPPGNAPKLNDEQHYLADSLDKKERPKDRVDAVLVNFGLIDPTEDIDDSQNYSQGVYLLNDGAQANYGTRYIATDRTSQSKLHAARTKGLEGIAPAAGWKCADASGNLIWWACTAAEIVEAANAAFDYVDQCFKREKELDQAVADGTFTEADLDTGWP